MGRAQPDSEDSENQQVEDSKHLGNTARLWFSITALNYPQCLLVRHSPQGYLIERKRWRCLTWHKSKQVMSSLCCEPYTRPTPRRAWHCLSWASGGAIGQKDGFLAPPAAGAHPRLLSQSLCVSVLCKFLNFITANSSPCSFLNFCLKKSTSLWFWHTAKQTYMFNLPPLLQWILIHFSNLFHLIFQNTNWQEDSGTYTK